MEHLFDFADVLKNWSKKYQIIETICGFPSY